MRVHPLPALAGLPARAPRRLRAHVGAHRDVPGSGSGRHRRRTGRRRAPRAHRIGPRASRSMTAPAWEDEDPKRVRPRREKAALLVEIVTTYARARWLLARKGLPA